MSRPSAAPLRIEAGPSRRLAVFLLSAHLAALAVVPELPLAWYLQLSLAALILFGFVDAWRAHVRRCSRRAIRAAELGPQGAWSLCLTDGRILAAQLLPSSFLHPELLVLNFRTGRLTRRHLVLSADAADADVLRRLRVRLRMGGGRRARNPGVE